ncbi:PAS domain-containing protein [Agrobacterium vaccinii]|jgi:PAS domain-containing protein|uniref:PAS domain-containing protein n=1 Tax=Agrobacterium TaxID=357 RepID=UPI000DD6CA24|nr:MULTISPECIES: PAS domain-containing protein [Agrobacterium]UHS58246.1 PAS domain-containing protein [Agrobacterium vaccinii]UHS62979.1 PAS domain-containing protein [Agrobacterium vaccinii]
MKKSLLTGATVVSSPHSMGFYTWHVAENKLYGDPYLAKLYGFSIEELAKGISVEQIFAIMVEDDRAVIASNVHSAILNAEPSIGRFRVRHSDGSTRTLISFGRCLHDEMGVPTFYTGAVMDASSPHIAEGSDPLQAHCRAALSIAERRGNHLAARYLSSALNTVSPGH